MRKIKVHCAIKYMGTKSDMLYLLITIQYFAAHIVKPEIKSPFSASQKTFWRKSVLNFKFRLSTT